MAGNINDYTGLVIDIQSYSVHDGPGCRTTIFLAGCFLKCLWCANPESWDLKEKVMFSEARCQYKNGCGQCIKVCEKEAISVNEVSGIRLDRTKCDSCSTFSCAKTCSPEALKLCGRRYTTEGLMSIINRDRDFWGQGGGVTFSGGEPFHQKQFLNHMLQKCKEAYIHTVVETTAHARQEDFLSVMKNIDFAFIDVKHMNSLRHKEQTGVGNEIILRNIQALVKNNWPGRLVLRMPVIQGFNDSEDNIAAIAEFMDRVGLAEINILPFHRLGASKWEQLGKDYAYKDYTPSPRERMEAIQGIFLRRRIACYIGNETVF